MVKRFDINKAAKYSIVINAIQICVILAIALAVLVFGVEHRSVLYMEFILCLATALVVWGSVVDIQQALSARRVHEQTKMLEEACGQLEALNMTLRAQRHDFMNHLQVVGSLVEMKEYGAAEEYIHRVYGDIQAVSSTLKTRVPAVNALLRVKIEESQKRGVFLDLHVYALWDGLPLQGWEMCRVLGNLIDNALDALAGVPEPRLTVMLGEDESLGHFTFAVENNGPEVPEDIREKLFLAGFTTKGRERGMGLFIVRKILRENGGDIVMETGREKTAFTGWLPRGGGGTSPTQRASTVNVFSDANHGSVEPFDG